ncbi:MAG: DnaB-like helicase C-terminal domain-containing protein [Balneolaceae bacterium]
MKLFDGKLELKALRLVFDTEGKKKYKTLASLKDDHFHTDSGKEVFNRLCTLVQKDSQIPSFDEMVHDPIISETTRSALKRIKIEDSDIRKSEKLVHKLDTFRKARALYFISDDLSERLSEDKIDIDELVEIVAERMSGIRTNNHTNEIFHTGKNNNTVSLVKKLLHKEQPDMIPTGFDCFDSVNCGLAYGSLVALAGNTGGGKTSLALQLANNMATIGNEDVFYIPLEMNEEETFERILANISGIDLALIKHAKLKNRHREIIMKEYKKWAKNLKKQGTRFSIFAPYDGITFTDALLTVTPFKPRAVVVDYLSLLKLRGKKDQWKELEEAAWEGKIWAKKNNTVCVMLAQINNEKELRYSKALKEHANNMWTWVATEDTRKQKIMHITQEKARNQKLFDFALGYDDNNYRVFDIDQSVLQKDKSENNGDKTSKKKSTYMSAADE